jgi:uncharacterized protein
MSTLRPRNRAELLNCLDKNPRLRPIFLEVSRRIDGDAAHDLGHLLRVAHSALELAGDELPFEEVIASALLHDLVNLPKNHPDRAQASELSAKASRPLLETSGFSPEAAERVCNAIRQHSYTRGEKPAAPLAAVLQDADRLEALGAIGLLRVISTGARLGAAYFHQEDPWALHRALDDKAYSVDHFFTKLLALPETMNTAAGKAEAARRARVLQHFLRDLAHELGTEPPAFPALAPHPGAAPRKMGPEGHA